MNIRKFSVFIIALFLSAALKAEGVTLKYNNLSLNGEFQMADG